MISDRMTAAALSTAKTRVNTVSQLGQTVTLVKAATKSELGDILTESTQDLKAFPIRFAPFDRKVSQSISFSEDTDVLFYVSKKQVDDLSLTINYLKKNYEKIRYNGRNYDIRYIEYYSQFRDDFLYIIIGAKI